MSKLECGALVATWAAFATMLFGAPAQASNPPSWLSHAAVPNAVELNHDHIDTEHIFGFTMGSDIGAKGDVELEIENVGLIGKRAGTYAAFSSLNLMKFGVTDDFRIAPGVVWGGNIISAAPGYENRSQPAFQGAVMELRYRLLDRETMPFGLTLHAQPGWTPTNEATGAQAQGYGGEFALLADKELVKDRLWAAVNLWYSLGASSDASANAWSRGSDLEVHGAMTTRVGPGLVMGGEIRYLRAHEGLGLDNFCGEALLLGPTFSMHLTKNIGLSGAVNVQVAGEAVGDPRALDLDNFERVQGMLRFNMLF